MPDRISVLLVDDHSLVRRGFRRMLEDEPDLHVVGEASDGLEAVQQAQLLKPRVIVMDCALPEMNGLQATRKILEFAPQTLILMLTMHTEDTWVRQAFEAGAKGYVLKNALDLELGSVIRKLVNGETVLDGQLSLQQSLKGERGSGLTTREIEILQLICDGKSNKEIAPQLGLEREHGSGASRQHHGCAGDSQDGGAGGVRDSQRAGEHSVNRRSFLRRSAGRSRAAVSIQNMGLAVAAAWIPFRRRNQRGGHPLPPQQRCLWRQAVCRKHWAPVVRSLTTTPTAGKTSCWSTAWTGLGTAPPAIHTKLYRNNRNGTFTDVTREAGLDLEMYGMGVAVGDYNNDGFPDILITCVGQNRLFRNTGKGSFVDVTNSSGLGKRLALQHICDVV